MTRSEAITELYALFGAPHNADINLTRLNKLLDELTAELVRADERAQRTWVGLTDEEIEQGCKESWVTEQAWQSAVWWAEARLKEKNT